MDATINGARIHYERAGTGLPVIFLHAGIADLRMWEPQVTAFAKHLDVIRLEGGGKYIGTVKVTSALNLFPKQAIVTFIPARNIPLDRLRVEDLPRKGDEVRPPNALTGGQ